MKIWEAKVMQNYIEEIMLDLITFRVRDIEIG